MQSDIRQRPEGALLRTYLRAAGIAPEAMSRPLVGVVTVSTQVFSEKPDSKLLGDRVVAGVAAAGGVAVRWDTVRTPDLMAWGHADGYSFAWRDQLADFIESWSQQQALNGLVLVGDACETLAGMAMAAARVNLPAIMVTAGGRRWVFTAEAGESKGRKPADPFDLLSQSLYANKPSSNRFAGDLFTECLLAQDNYESRALELALEALGVSVPGMATAAPGSAKGLDLALASGKRIMNLIETGWLFRRFLSANAFTNAARLDAALGGSVDVAVNLMAIAQEAGIPLSWDLFDRVCADTPQVVRAHGTAGRQTCDVEDLDRVGGVWAVFHLFRDKVLPTATVCGKGASELAKITAVKSEQVVSLRVSGNGGLGVLKGNLCPKGGLFLRRQVPSSLTHFQGPCVVFDDEAAAARMVSDGSIKKGVAVVVRGQGPKGGPGLLKLRVLPALLQSRGLNKSVPILTDGRLPMNGEGLYVSLISPEGVVPGPFGVLRTGDILDLDTKSGQLNVRLTDMEMRIRISRFQAPTGKTKRGFLDRYSRLVSEASEGAILK